MDEVPGAGPREAIPSNVVKVVLDGLQDDDAARDDFIEGLGKHLHFMSMDPTPAVVEAAMHWLRGWLFSVFLARDESWTTQAAEHDRRVAAGESSPGVTSAELRSLIDR